jgi:peptidoglycan/LPS O-acetylase OafA/YrhL
MPFAFIFESYHSRDKWIAELSYPIYSSHILVLLMINFMLPTKIILAETILLITILFSITVNFFTGKPFENLRNKKKFDPINDLW